VDSIVQIDPEILGGTPVFRDHPHVAVTLRLRIRQSLIDLPHL